MTSVRLQERGRKKHRVSVRLRSRVGVRSRVRSRVRVRVFFDREIRESKDPGIELGLTVLVISRRYRQTVAIGLY